MFHRNKNFRISSWLVVKVFRQNIKVVNPPMVWEAKNTKPSRSNFHPALFNTVLSVSTSSLLFIPPACPYTRDYIASAYSTDTWHIISFGQHKPGLTETLLPHPIEPAGSSSSLNFSLFSSPSTLPLSPSLLSASAGATTKAAQPRRPILTTLATYCASTTLAGHCAYTTLALLLQRIVPPLHLQGTTLARHCAHTTLPLHIYTSNAFSTVLLPCQNCTVLFTLTTDTHLRTSYNNLLNICNSTRWAHYCTLMVTIYLLVYYALYIVCTVAVSLPY